MPRKRFPGLIDIHCHLREPGAVHKEDFSTGSRSAVKGGFVFIVDMPNNPLPTTSLGRLRQKISLAQKKSICEVGFYYGTNGKNIRSFKQAWGNNKIFGLKVYCNHTTGDLLIDKLGVLEEVFKNWHSSKPILVHAEDIHAAAVLALAHCYNRRLHICHLSTAEEVELVKKAKSKKQKVTAGATPHHLFLTDKDREKMGSYAEMKPPLRKKKDQEALWQAVRDRTIDVIETDHAPHTIKEKEKDPPVFGVPGFETAFALALRAVRERKIKHNDIVRLFCVNPKRIFNIPALSKTYLEVDLNKEFVVGEEGYETKCGWSPFDKWILKGKIEKVVLKGKTLLDEGRLL